VIVYNDVTGYDKHTDMCRGDLDCWFVFHTSNSKNLFVTAYNSTDLKAGPAIL
jgi:hypothetical protein